MDFVVGIPRTLMVYESIWVIVDHLTKSAHFLSVKTTYSVAKYAQLYLDEIVKLHGVLVSIISDRGPQFSSRFWKAFLEARVDVSIDFHPQIDDQSEKTI